MPGWTVHLDNRNQRAFYYHAEFGDRRWTRPRPGADGPDSTGPDDEEAAALFELGPVPTLGSAAPPEGLPGMPVGMPLRRSTW
jgi:hypothetical protein